MAVRLQSKTRLAALTAVIVAVALCIRWLTAPPLTPGHHALVGTWTDQSATGPTVNTAKSQLTLGPGHSATKADYVNGPAAAPQVYHFTWRVEPEGLVVQHDNSLVDRLSGRISTPEFFGLVSV